MHYNTVLIPEKALEEKLYDFVRQAYKNPASEYCIQKGAVIPHITLGGFETSGSDTLEKYCNALKLIDYPDLLIKFHYFYFSDISKETKTANTGIGVHNTQALQDLQDAITRLAEDHDLTLFNATGVSYWPHLTFGRIYLDDLNPGFVPPLDLFDQDGLKGWTLAFGRSDQNGQFLEILERY